jgi:hypothetical protein
VDSTCPDNAATPKRLLKRTVDASTSHKRIADSERKECISELPQDENIDKNDACRRGGDALEYSFEDAWFMQEKRAPDSGALCVR